MDGALGRAQRAARAMGAGASLDGFEPSGPVDNEKFYAILGVGRDASEDEIKKGYKKAAVKWHPDKWANKPEAEQKEAEEKFKAAAEAYEVLSDKSKKEVYDRYGEAGLKSGGPSSSSGIVPMAGFPAGAFMASGLGPGVRVSFTTSGGGPGFGMSNSRAEEIFAALFSGGLFDDDDDDLFTTRRRAPPQRPPQRPPPLRSDLLPRDTNVKLVGLSSSSNLNGSLGAIAGFDDQKRRYTVRLPNGNEVAVKPLNVRQTIAGARLDLPTSKKFGFAQSVSGTAVYDTPNARYDVTDLPNSNGIAHSFASINAKPENVILPADTRVTAIGLNGRPELNGQAGRVLSSDGGDRYVVEMASSGEQVKLKYGNVVALHGHNPYVGEF